MPCSQVCNSQRKLDTQGRRNAGRERIWFSPHCLRPQENLFQADISASYAGRVYCSRR